MNFRKISLRFRKELQTTRQNLPRRSQRGRNPQTHIEVHETLDVRQRATGGFTARANPRMVRAPAWNLRSGGTTQRSTIRRGGD